MHFVFSLFLPMCVILISCALFTRAIEKLGVILRVGDSVVGSIFAAVGTCLPETLIPIIAVCQMMFAGEDINTGSETAMGAILGAPFMLATVAFPLLALSVFLFRKRRRLKGRISVDVATATQDLNFFCLAVTCIFIISMISTTEYFSFGVRIISGAILCAIYIIYVWKTVRAGRINEDCAEVRLKKHSYKISFREKLVVFIGLGVSLAGIIFGANEFVNGIEEVSEIVGLSPMLLSLIVAPIATELPEKLNSIIWIGKESDTLAFGNITGAMVFQACVPAAIGVVFTTWEIDIITLYTLCVTQFTALVVLGNLNGRGGKGLSTVCLVFPIVFYAIYVGYVIMFLQ